MRVFNISLHRMGTTSMWTALSQLGFTSLHFMTDLCYQYLDNKLEGSKLLRSDNIAISDLPMPVMYRKLYKMFPDAKFIRVTRPFEPWFESVKAHLKRPGIIPFVHVMLYGYPITHGDCDEDLCRTVYDRFHADVDKFFSDKGSLLRLDLDNLSWEPLCEFLGREIPNREFPHVYKTPIELREDK